MPPSCSRPPNCANRKGSCYELTTKELNDLLNEPGSKRKIDVAKLTPQQRCTYIRKLGMHFDRRVDKDTCLRLKRVEDMVSGGQMNRWRQLSVLLNSAYPGKAGLKKIEEIENSPKEFAPMLKAVEQVFFGGKVPYRTVVEMTEEPDYPAYAYTIGSSSTLYINRPRMNQLIEQMHEYHEDGKKAALNDETSGKIKVLGGIPLNMFTPLTSVAGILAHEYIHVIQSNCKDTSDEREYDFHGPIFRHVANLFTGSSVSNHSSAHTMVDRDIVYADKLPDDNRELVDRPDEDPSVLNPTRELMGMKAAGYPARAIEDDSTAEYRARVAARRKIYKTIRTSQRMGDNLLQIFVDDAEVTFTSAYRKNQKYKFVLHFMDNDPTRDMKRRIKINEEHDAITKVLDAIYARYPPVLKAVTKAKFEHAGDGNPPPFGSANDRPPGFEDVTPAPPSRPARAKYARAPFGAMNEVASMRRGGYPKHALDDSSEEYRHRLAARGRIQSAMRESWRVGDNHLVVSVLETGTVTMSSDHRPHVAFPFSITYIGGKRRRKEIPVSPGKSGENNVISTLLNDIYATYPNMVQGVERAQLTTSKGPQKFTK